MVTQEGFKRHICAVLLADVSGFSALMGEDDEATAQAVDRVQRLVQDIAAEAGGHAEPTAGDAVLATFESVVAAVNASIRIQHRLHEETFGGKQLRLRIGIHFGDVLVRESATFGDAINIAARLQALATPGTVCISDGVYRHIAHRLDEKVIDLGQKRLKNISDPVHAYLIDPLGVHAQAPKGVSSPAARRWSLAAAAAILLGVSFVLLRTQHAPVDSARRDVDELGTTVEVEEKSSASLHQVGEQPGQTEPITLGVMVFKTMGATHEGDWRCEALRDGLNTQLSQLSKVKVYSKEFIDFVISRKGLTDIEAATQLGIRKMLSGSFVAVGKTLRIETHVVDVASGVLEASYTTTGDQEDFLELQSKMVWEVITRLDIPVTTEERTLLLAQRNTSVEALKLLLEAEGGAPSDTDSPERHEPTSGLPTWLALRDAFLPGPVVAQANGADEQIRDLLERYRKATEAQQIDAVEAMHTAFPAEKRAALERYFDNVSDLKVSIEDIDIVVVGDEAVVSYTRADDFADKRTGRPMHVAVRLTKTLLRQEGVWKLAEQ